MQEGVEGHTFVYGDGGCKEGKEGGVAVRECGEGHTFVSWDGACKEGKEGGVAVGDLLERDTRLCVGRGFARKGEGNECMRNSCWTVTHI